MDTVRVEGRCIAYHRAGHGPPLMLLHGGGSDGREWWLQLAALSDEFDVIAWDAPGCGGSDDPPEGVGFDAYADTLAGFVAALGLARPHVCGLSFGAALALAVYGRHPHLARSLVLASGYAGWRGSLPPEEVDARVQRIWQEMQQPPESYVDDSLAHFFPRKLPPEIEARVRSIMLDVRPAGTLAMLSAFADVDLRHVLPTIAVPTLLLYGDADVRAPRPVADALHAAIPRSRLVVLPGVGHVINVEAPDAFNAELRRFLRSVP